MLCPKCRKQDNKVISYTLDKSNNCAERKRKCECGYQFFSFELLSPENIKISKLKIARLEYRKRENRSHWLDWRIATYGRFLMMNVSRSMMSKYKEIEKKHKKAVDIKNVRKINGKLHYEIHVKNGQEYKFKYEMKKMDTIREIIELPAYWEGRTGHFPDKSVEDMKSRDKKIAEARQYLKSVSDHIKDSKYNKDFFRSMDPEAMYWQYQYSWDIFKAIR